MCSLDPASGRYFYAHGATGQSTWDHPRLSPAANAAYVASLKVGTASAAAVPAAHMTPTELAHARHKAEAQKRLMLQNKSIAQQQAVYGTAGGGGSAAGYAVAADMATTNNGWDGGPSGKHGDGGQSAVSGGMWGYQLSMSLDRLDYMSCCHLCT